MRAFGIQLSSTIVRAPSNLQLNSSYSNADLNQCWR